MADRDERGRLLPGHGVVSPGRPRTEAAEKLRAALEGVVDNGTMLKWKAAMKRKLERGDPWATQFVYERIAGKVPDQHVLGGDPDAPILIDIITELVTGDDPASQ